MPTIFKSIMRNRYVRLILLISLIINLTTADISYALRPSASTQSVFSRELQTGLIDPEQPRGSSAGRSWIEEHAPELVGKFILSCSMEGALYELTGDAREASTMGGLGIYYGDKLEGLHDIGADGAGCMPLYANRFVQKIVNGTQYKERRQISYDGQPLQQVTDADGSPVILEVWGWNKQNTYENKKYHVSVYKIYRGGTPLYLFYCPEVFDLLYTDIKNDRFLQEVIFGRCVFELLRRVGRRPDIIHCNEGHVANVLATIRQLEGHEAMARVYTNHSLVEAALEKYAMTQLDGGDPGRIRYIFDVHGERGRPESVWDQFMGVKDGQPVLDLSKGALGETDIANGVSAEHAEVTAALFPWYKGDFIGILNGSGDYWVFKELLEIERQPREPSDDELRQIRLRAKQTAFADIKRRTAGTMTNQDGKLISETGIEFDPNRLTTWLVRRLTHYKSQYPILRFLIHIMCADRSRSFTRDELRYLWYRDSPDLADEQNSGLVEHVLNRIFEYARHYDVKDQAVVYGLGMQVVVGSPTCDDNVVYWLQRFVKWMGNPDLNGRFVYVPSDNEFLKMQAIGSDICINCPLPGQEAAGTSDQRTARNYGVNIATYSGGPPEYMVDGESGFLVGPYRDNDEFYWNAPGDFFGKLFAASDMYYSQGSDSRWVDMQRRSHAASANVTAVAMEQRYATDAYVPALKIRSEKLTRSSSAGTGLSEPQPSKRALEGFFTEHPDLRELYDLLSFKSATAATRLKYLRQLYKEVEKLPDFSVNDRQGIYTGLIDLHHHSAYSDGESVPAEIVFRAWLNGAKAIAIVDHNTFNGAEEALLAGEILGIKVIVGVELDMEDEELGLDKFHMLAYINPGIKAMGFNILMRTAQARYLSQAMNALQEELRELNEARMGRFNRLQKEEAAEGGMYLEPGDIKPFSFLGIPNRFHLAEALLRKYGSERFGTNDERSIADRYFPEHIDEYPDERIDRMPVSVVIPLLIELGMLVVIPHPGQRSMFPDISVIESLLARYAAVKVNGKWMQGIHGVEVFSSKNDPKQTAAFSELVDRLNADHPVYYRQNLLKTVSSDGHDRSERDMFSGRIDGRENGSAIPDILLHEAMLEAFIARAATLSKSSREPDLGKLGIIELPHAHEAVVEPEDPLSFIESSA